MCPPAVAGINLVKSWANSHFPQILYEFALDFCGTTFFLPGRGREGLVVCLSGRVMTGGVDSGYR